MNAAFIMLAGRPDGAGLVPWLVVAQTAAPALALAAIGIAAILGRPLAERTTTRLVGASFATAFAAAVALLALLATRGFPAEIVHLGTWFAVGHHEATIDLVADGLSVPYVCFSTGLCLLVNVFAGRYLHREPGFTRFFVLLALFGLGMNLMVLAGSIDVLFAGWEFIGVSSMLLIGFFHERPNAVQAAMRGFITYRICDVGILAAGVVVHGAVGSGDFDRLFHGSWPDAECLVPASTAATVGLLLVFAALGKAAQVPFSGWLPRAMEGPTPSSAIFYGALSIHAGPYVLLRCEPLLDAAHAVGWLLVAIGTATAMHASVVGRVQTDLKSMLAYGSMMQAGLIMVEIGLGWRVIPLLHVVSHAVLRSLQILRSPSALHDRHALVAALGGPPGEARSLTDMLPGTWRAAAYRVALERGYEDMAVLRFIVEPFRRFVEWIDAAERAGTAWLGEPRPRGPRERRRRP